MIESKKIRTLVVGSFHDSKGPVLDVLRYSRVCEITSDQSLRVKDSVVRVHRRLCLRSLSNQSLSVVREGDIRGSSSVTLVITDNVDLSISVCRYVCEYVWVCQERRERAKEF